MRILTPLFTFAATAATVFACGGSSNDGTTFTPVSTTTLQALSGTYCNKATECTSEVLVQVVYGSVDTCKARFLQQAQLSAKGAGYGLGEQAGAACNSAIGAATCQDILNGVLPEACRITGSLADGSSCADDAQCVSGSCFVAETASCGKCGPRAGVGADCTNASCERGLKCGSDKKCTNGQAGATCTKDDDCRALTACRKGVCIEPLQEGAACDSGADDPPCDLTKALLCLEKTCKKVTLTSVATGETCGLTGSAAAAVCSNGDCKSDKCVAWAADGTDCTADAESCQEPAKCRNGKCALLDPVACK